MIGGTGDDIPIRHRLSIEGGDKFKRDLDDAGGVAEVALARMAKAGALAATALTAIGAGAALAVQAAEKLNRIEGQLRALTGSAGQAEQLMGRLFDQTQKLGAGFEESAGAFTRFARAGAELGRTQTEILRFSETTQKLALIGGASAQEAAAGAMQLAQGLASGVLQGDELRSVLESMPPVAKAIADGFGVSVGELRRLGSEGQLSAQKVFDAIITSAPKADEQFKALGDSVERAGKRLDNSWTKFLADIDKFLKLTPATIAALDSIRGGVDAAASLVAPRSSDDLRAERERLQGFVNIGSPELAGIPEDQRQFVPLPADIEQQLAGYRRRIAEIDAELFSRFKKGAAEMASGVSEETRNFLKRFQEQQDLSAKVDRALEGINIRKKEAIALARIEDDLERSIATSRLKARDGILKAEGLEAPGAIEALRKSDPIKAASIDRLVAGAQNAAGEETRAEAVAAGRRALLSSVPAAIDKGAEADLKAYVEQLNKQIDAQLESTRTAGLQIKASQEHEQAMGAEVARVRELIQTDDQRRQSLQAKITELQRYGLTAEEAALALEKLDPAAKEAQSAARELGLTFSSALEDVIVRVGKAGDVARALGQDIIRIFTRRNITEPLVKGLDDVLKKLFEVRDASNSIGGGGGGGGILSKLIGGVASFFGGGFSLSGGGVSGLGDFPISTGTLFAANGAVLDAGRMIPFASGGIVDRPTVFPMRGGTGLMGEAGPEAIMPLRRGADGKLGVAGGQPPTGNTYYIDARGADRAAVERLERSLEAVGHQVWQMDKGFEDRAAGAALNNRKRNPGAWD